MASLPELSDGTSLTHFIVAEDVERAGRLYSGVLGDEIVLAAGEPTIVALANSWTSNAVIDQATGILMARNSCTYEEALKALTTAADLNQLTPDELAEVLIADQDLR